MKAYVLSSNIYKNSCESDSPEDILEFIGDLLRKGPIGTQIHITVRDIPQELWDAQPKFEGWNDGHSSD